MGGRADDFTERVLDVVDSIPAGSVMTYGDVAAAVGSRAARAVGGVMKRAGRDVPWWRVVRSTGQPAVVAEDLALGQLREEGAPIVEGPDGTERVDLSRARHHP